MEYIPFILNKGGLSDEKISRIYVGTRLCIQFGCLQWQTHHRFYSWSLKAGKPWFAAVLEPFYEDENAVYSFPYPISTFIIVTYLNGESEDIITALESGRATISDLDKFGIDYYTEPKK